MKESYLYNKWIDGIFILSPPFVSLLIVACLPARFQYGTVMPLSAWVILVLMIDVAHVYSTLFRTYLDRETFAEQKSAMIAIPVLSLVIAMLVYGFSDRLFWTLLAYLAVFHFIRQQYGFMRLYSRSEKQGSWARWLDTLAVYAATLYPLVYWHLHPGRNFNWFIEGDFLQADWPQVSQVCLGAYLVVLAAYVVKEAYRALHRQTFNLPKNLVVLGTAFSWYFGIVFYNGDLVFTLLNVVAHGIPYMALVWIWGRKKSAKGGFESSRFQQKVFTGAGLLVFIALLLAFAFVEEGLWDALVWREHRQVFAWFNRLFSEPRPELLRLLVPLLALPQIVHYVIDGYIWKMKSGRYDWSKQLLK